MNYITYQSRLQYLKELIKKGRVQSPSDAAKKFDCSEKTIRRMIKVLCEQGDDISYCRKQKKYLLNI